MGESLDKRLGMAGVASEHWFCWTLRLCSSGPGDVGLVLTRTCRKGVERCMVLVGSQERSPNPMELIRNLGPDRFRNPGPEEFSLSRSSLCWSRPRVELVRIRVPFHVNNMIK